MKKEVFVPIVGFEGLYEVSNLGTVKRVEHWVDRKKGGKQLLNEKICKHTKTKMGYYRLSLWKNNIGTPFLIHRLLAIHFIANPNNKPHINHIDCDKGNNSLSNLEWVTRSENIQHAMKMGVMKNQFKSGFDSQLCKLTPEDVKGIKKMRKEGKTLREIGEYYGISGRHVSGIYRGETHAGVN